MQRISEHSLLTASPISIHPEPISTPSVRPPLPDRNVTDASIEDAYVTFILHCNPAVPLDTDSVALREAFRTPPKSGGKTFSTFTLFELIKQLETKALRTWGELALKLGVEPPDQEKGQSSQKIQQYAVRLKRWMHSMHVDAFFEYLMDRPHPYWTEIPADDTPITEMGRDGVAAEDDMALRALLPQIKPRRGRRKPDDDDTGKSPSQRPSPHADVGDYGVAGAGAGARQPQEGQEPWTAQPVERGSVFLFPAPSQARLQPPAPALAWGASDTLQTPMTAYPHPHSAITPVTRNSFWADEPRSAITPGGVSKSGSRASRRHGAKVVSSAWRIGGTSRSGKTRGRPPNSRVGGGIDGPFSAFPASGVDVPTFKLPSPTPASGDGDRSATATGPTSAPAPAPIPPTQQSVPPTSTTDIDTSSPQQSQPESALPPRPAKRSRLSLQVPERVGGEVRLATPPLPPPPLSAPAMAPPVLMVNGLPPQHQQGASQQPQPHVDSVRTDPTGVMSNPQRSGGGGPVTAAIPNSFSSGHHNHQQHQPPQPNASGDQQNPKPVQQHVFFKDETDRTNKHELEAFFVHEIITAKWLSAKGEPIPPCEADEAWGLAQTVVENLLKASASKESFLINLAALAGGKLLMAPNGLKITRLEPESGPLLPGRTRYSCDWELQYGDIRGNFSMQEAVPDEKWKKAPDTEDEESLTWKRRYEHMSNMLQQRDREVARLRSMVVGALKDSGRVSPPPSVPGDG